jgi:hypothetical protein
VTRYGKGDRHPQDRLDGDARHGVDERIERGVEVRPLAEEIGVVGQTDEIAQVTDLSVAQTVPELESERKDDRPRHDERRGGRQGGLDTKIPSPSL